MSRVAVGRARLEITLGATAAVLLLVAAARWRGALAPPAGADVTLLPPAAAPPRRFDAVALARATELVVATDPFRLANRPASVRYQARRVGAPPPAPRGPQPVLVLKAIIGGPPWQAIIDGIPGQAGAVVRAGDVFDKLVVRAVTRDTVVVQGPDTTWKLTLQRG